MLKFVVCLFLVSGVSFARPKCVTEYGTKIGYSSRIQKFTSTSSLIITDCIDHAKNLAAEFDTDYMRIKFEDLKNLSRPVVASFKYTDYEYFADDDFIPCRIYAKESGKWKEVYSTKTFYFACIGEAFYDVMKKNKSYKIMIGDKDSQLEGTVKVGPQ